MEFNPKVSIIIPVYNGSNFLREAIDSALNQTYRNVEVIVVNDGSSDGGKTEEIARSFGNKICYFYKENGGVASALNLGIRKMSGEWFAWLSHDDLFSSDRIQEDMNLIRNNPDIKVLFCNVLYIDSEGGIIGGHDYEIARVTNSREAWQLGGLHMCTITIHRSCFEKTGLFNESNSTTQDVEMSLLLSKYFTLFHNNRTVTYVREHPERGTNKLKKQHQKDKLKIAELIKNKFTFEDFFPERDKIGRKQLAQAWVWLGDVYRFLGAYNYADKCYKEGYSNYKKLLNKGGIKYIVGAMMIDSAPFRLIENLVSYERRLRKFLRKYYQ